jgi:hypothetical protein
MNKAHTALFGAIFSVCTCASAQTTPGPPAPGASAAQGRASPDPGIVERPPARVDPNAIERPPPNVDPKMIERPPPRPATASSAAVETSRKTRKSAPPSPVASGGPDLPSVIVVPHGQPADARLGKGCWVQFYDEKAYGGRSLTLVGPVQMEKMNIPGGLWVNWSSAVVGPAATVATFDYEHFKNRTAVLRPGQSIPDLHDGKLGLFEDIHSLRIGCRGVKAASPAPGR